MPGNNKKNLKGTKSKYKYKKLTLEVQMICGANQWTGFYMISASVMKGLKKSERINHFVSSANNLAFVESPSER